MADYKACRRTEIRSLLLEEAGGKCVRCGYDKCQKALHFHHLDSIQKDFELSKLSVSVERARKEIAKCELVCANCHAEIHADMM